MNCTIGRLCRVALVAAILGGAGAPSLDAAPPRGVVVAAGTLERLAFAGDLFHIDEFWMHVAEATEFNRWLAQGLDRQVVVRLAAGGGPGGDEPNARVLSGLLMHQTVPKPTSFELGLGPRLPRGDSGFAHQFFVKDEIAGAVTLSPVTFETADSATAAKFSPFDGARVTIVIEID